jgi:hypothetical protein
MAGNGLASQYHPPIELIVDRFIRIFDLPGQVAIITPADVSTP